MENKFRVLRFVGSLYKVIAWILLILGVLGGIGAILAGIFGNSAIGGQMADLTGLGTEGLLAGLALGVGLLVGAVLQFVLLYAAGEVITLALALERNTRETAYYMRGDAHAAPYNG